MWVPLYQSYARISVLKIDNESTVDLTRITTKLRRKLSLFSGERHCAIAIRTHRGPLSYVSRHGPPPRVGAYLG